MLGKSDFKQLFMVKKEVFEWIRTGQKKGVCGRLHHILWKKTILLQGITWTAVYEPAPKPVGGKATPINIPTIKPEVQTPWMYLTIILPLATTVVFIKLKKKKQLISICFCVHAVFVSLNKKFQKSYARAIALRDD